MRSFQAIVPTTSASLESLCNNEVTRCRGVLMQAPLENTGKIYFGERGAELAFILNGGTAGVDVMNLRDIYVKGNGTDSVIVIAY